MKPFSTFLAFLPTAEAALFLPNWVKRRVFLLHWVHNGANKRTEKDQRVVKLRFSWLTFSDKTLLLWQHLQLKKIQLYFGLVYEAIDCLLKSPHVMPDWEDDLMSFGRISKYLNSEEQCSFWPPKVIRKKKLNFPFYYFRHKNSKSISWKFLQK